MVFSFGVILQVQTRWPDATAVALGIRASACAEARA